MTIKKKLNVLAIEDDHEFCTALTEVLELRNLTVSSVRDQQGFLKALAEQVPDIILLDRRLGAVDGFDLIPVIRDTPAWKNIPVIVLSGYLDLEEKTRALNMGADDCLSKTIDTDELLARIIACHRRGTFYRNDENIVELENIKINFSLKKAYLNQKELVLTKIEFNLLTEMITNIGQILQRESLASKLLTLRNNNSRTLDVHINSLRKKMGPDSDRIRTVRGRGYVFQPQEPTQVIL